MREKARGKELKKTYKKVTKYKSRWKKIRTYAANKIKQMFI